LTGIPHGGILGGIEHKRGHGTHGRSASSGLVKRLSIIEGQVRGLRKMPLEGVYCIDVITQTSAVKKALSSVEDKLMEEHLGSCAIDQIKMGKEGKAIGEILKVYRLKRK